MEFFQVENEFIKISLNPKLYNLETIYSAAYQIMEDAFVILDGDPDTEITVNLSYKEDTKNNGHELSALAKKFMNQLVNYTFYKINSQKKELLRALLLKKSFENIDLEKFDESLETSSEAKENAEEENCEECKEEKASGKKSGTVLSDEEESVFENGAETEDEEDEEDEASADKDKRKYDDGSDNEMKEEDLEFDDPEGIAIPWEEKYGGNNAKKAGERDED
jgi:His-Xaa-Ser system protein HxsD